MTKRKDKEVAALMSLLDDPDDEVYDTVANKIVNYGSEIIPALEHFWEVTPDQGVQSRIEDLIHRVHFQDLEAEFADWCESPQPELLRGAILVAKYHYPNVKDVGIAAQFEQMRRNVWLELNNYLSPLEQVNVINSILYSYYKLNGHELTERDPGHFFINHVLESRHGNAYTIGVIYLALCEALDIPIFAVDVPRQFIFAFLHVLPDVFEPYANWSNKAQFFVDPQNGMIYSQNDVEVYLRKINATDRDDCFLPLDNKRIIYKLLEELSLCYGYKKEERKAEEVRQLMTMLRAHF
jgi:regulator of sirC expression with transglutaminase-like and TPR domain